MLMSGRLNMAATRAPLAEALRMILLDTRVSKGMTPEPCSSVGVRFRAASRLISFGRKSHQCFVQLHKAMVYSAASPFASIISKSRLSISCIARPAMP
ncbi:hypothetical protein ABIF62_000112 [Bradyrhizobium japonicum]|jgi:hypothetical protein|nr:hypothetical protein [Bradyrhizobium japonicum]